MIKNIILDIGGVMFDDSLENISKLLGYDAKEVYKKAYGSGFRECLLGNSSVSNLIEGFKDDFLYKDIKYILDYNNLYLSYPIIKCNFNYIKSLKDKGYKLYILSNITEESYRYIDDTININSIFEGGCYSYMEGMKKPDYEFYKLVIDRYNLNKDETVFFDDKEKNVNAFNELGVKSYVFKSIDDIKKVIGE